jgi:hypothetical protein
MAAVTVSVTPAVFHGAKLNRTATANSEDVYTVTNTNSTSKQWYLQIIFTTSAGLYHTAAGQVVANGFQIPVGTPFNIPIGQGTTVFYIAAAAAGTSDLIAYTYSSV